MSAPKLKRTIPRSLYHKKYEELSRMYNILLTDFRVLEEAYLHQAELFDMLASHDMKKILEEVIKKHYKTKQ